MALTNRDRVGRALETLQQGLAPFVEREIHAAIKEQKVPHDILRRYADDDQLAGKPIAEWDVAALLKLMAETWNQVFRESLGRSTRTLVFELRDWRNKWAHQEPFSSDDTLRALDSVERLLRAVGAASEADAVERSRKELLRRVFDEQVRSEKRKSGGSLIEVAASGKLKPWREVIEPHDDVASGRYRQAEFAADLWQVYLGEGEPEYRDPVEFFRRTYLTESLKRLLAIAARRLAGSGGDPVIHLQTNFGGGKTHSMLALYHLFSGLRPSELPGVEEVLSKEGIEELPPVNRVVLDGHRISPGSPMVKEDGTRVHTLWGELAWQLGFSAGGLEEARRAYELVREDDERATNPGDRLRQLLSTYAPALILIDEWVAYARQLRDGERLPGGDFETQFTFAQALTESVKAVPRTLLVVSLPASDSGIEDVEVGGERGKEALRRLRNVVGRIESPWRPASAEESFEIVRRRLFKPITDPEAYRHRDVTARAFSELYQRYAGEFPAEAKERSYEERIKAAYPIHPEVFDRLYSDWAALATFQRTRGVLRLMASVVHTLWEGGDQSPLILPATLPLDAPEVIRELVRHLSDNWTPIIEKDVDGPRSLPAEIDRSVPNLGRYHATRRVARAIFLGSAPKVGAAQRGLEEKRVKLGAIMPGEPPAVFGDALRRLADRATYLYRDQDRYWYDVQPTVTKLAEDRAEQLKAKRELVLQEIEAQVGKALRASAGSMRVHAFPKSSTDVPDEPEARLVVLSPEAPHQKSDPESPALREAEAILKLRGNAPRQYQNALVFLAADQNRLEDLEDTVRRYLAWKSILDEREQLNLTPFQVRQAESQLKEAEEELKARIPETYIWLIVPIQDRPEDPVQMETYRLNGSRGLVERAVQKLVREGLLARELAPGILRKYLDNVPLWDDHEGRRDAAVEKLVDYFFSYPYLPRLEKPQVLLESVSRGVGLLTWERDSFAWAERFDEKMERYVGLVAGQAFTLREPSGLVVHPDTARRQFERELTIGPTDTGAGISRKPVVKFPETSVAREEVEEVEDLKPELPRRFYGRLEVESRDLVKEAGKLAKELVTHLAKLPRAKVRVRIEVDAEVPDGIPEDVVRVVRENARVLNVSGEFE